MRDDRIEDIDRQLEAERAASARIEALGIVSADELKTRVFPPRRYLVDEMIPDSGLVLIAASKAAGKTFISLQLAESIGAGLPFMGKRSSPGKVLFLELELSERRIHERLNTMRLETGNIEFLFGNFPAGREAIALLEDLTKRYSLIVIDVVSCIFPRDSNMNDYGDTYAFLSPIRKAAHDNECVVFLNSHNRKAETEDILDQAMGSVGIVANCDVILTLKRIRGQSEAVLHCNGNDIESAQIPLMHDPASLRFVLSDRDPRETELTPERRKVLAVLKSKGVTKLSEIAKEAGTTTPNASNLLKSMEQTGLVRNPKTGFWEIT
jgi:hypothetical protein